nr:GDSL esterase/lipase At1g28570-like [Quercus suber]
MDLSSSLLSLKLPFIKLLLSLLIVTIRGVAGSCYTSIYSFGDSYVDSGNMQYLDADVFGCYVPPFGESYFHLPTGRCSNGRLIVDLTAELFGLPLPQPYLKTWNESVANVQEGINFAVSGATVLDASFFEEIGSVVLTNVTLRYQLNWFKDFLAHLCNTSSKCNEIIGSSIFLVGEMGGDDYNYMLFSGISLEDMPAYVTLVVKAMATAINELIDLGAVTLLVPGILPIGCSPSYLTKYETEDIEEYDPETGCLTKYNKLAEYHNEQLQKELQSIQALNPQTNIIYADYYNASMGFFRSPAQYGFTREGTLKSCCGGGGPYNYNTSLGCGQPSTILCDDPSQYVSWDGVHLTEAAYAWITVGLLEGPYTTPRLSTLCISENATKIQMTTHENKSFSEH